MSTREFSNVSRTGWAHRTLIATVAAATVSGWVAFAAPALAHTDDVTFLRSLDEMGISYPDPDGAVAGGQEVCRYLSEGHSAHQAAKGVKNANPSLTLTKATQFVGAAQSAYCR